LFIDRNQVFGGVRLVVRGEVDVATAGQLERELRAALGTRGRVELDLAGVEFMDSMGLHALLEPTVASGRRLVLCDASRQVTRLLEAAGITNLFDSPEEVLDLQGRRIDDLTAELDAAIDAYETALQRNEDADTAGKPRPFGRGALLILMRRIDDARVAATQRGVSAT